MEDQTFVNTVDGAMNARNVEDQAFVNTVDGALDARNVMANGLRRPKRPPNDSPV